MQSEPWFESFFGVPEGQIRNAYVVRGEQLVQADGPRRRLAGQHPPTADVRSQTHEVRLGGVGRQVDRQGRESAAKPRLRGGVREFGIGRLTLPTLTELRTTPSSGTPNRLREVLGDVTQLHAAHPGAVFQAASQFNLLEMASPRATPAHGVSIYVHDRTQGPAVALCAPAALVYRNYFVPHDGHVGQLEQQLDALAGVGRALGNTGDLWRMVNGYALGSAAGIAEAGRRLRSQSAEQQLQTAGELCVGVHADVEVRNTHHQVTQIYGSAVPIAYSGVSADIWEPVARLVLNASYEATLRVAARHANRTGNRTVFLTWLGGGVFGNPLAWIIDAIRRANQVVPAGLDVRVVSYRSYATGQQPLSW